MSYNKVAIERVSVTDEKERVAGNVVWMSAAHGEQQAVRVDSRYAGAAYAVIESVAEPGTAVPTHLQRNEAEHFLVLTGHYVVAIGDEVLDAPAGLGGKVPRNTPHNWRNISDGESRLSVTIVPGVSNNSSINSIRPQQRRSTVLQHVSGVTSLVCREFDAFRD